MKNVLAMNLFLENRKDCEKNYYCIRCEDRERMKGYIEKGLFVAIAGEYRNSVVKIYKNTDKSGINAIFYRKLVNQFYNEK